MSRKLLKREIRLKQIRSKLSTWISDDGSNQFTKAYFALSTSKRLLIRNRIKDYKQKELEHINIICSHLEKTDPEFSKIAFDSYNNLKDAKLQLSTLKDGASFSSTGVKTYIGQLDSTGMVKLVANKKRFALSLILSKTVPYKWIGKINCLGNITLDSDLEDSALNGVSHPDMFSIKFGYKGLVEMLTIRDTKRGYLNISYPIKIAGRLNDSDSLNLIDFNSNKGKLLKMINDFRDELTRANKM